MAYPVLSGTVTADTTPGVIDLTGLPTGIPYFFIRMFNAAASGGVVAYGIYKARGGGANVPAVDGVTGDAIPPQAAYQSPMLKASDYPTPTAGPEFYAASSRALSYTVWAAADGEQP